MSFCVRGEPQGKARPRFAPGGNIYTPPTTKKYEAEILTAYRAAAAKVGWKEPPSGYASMSLTVGYKIPKSASKAKRGKMLEQEILPDKKPDLDNVIKVVLDALNGVAYKDDKQVVMIHAQKYYTDNPHISVEVIT